MNLDTETVDTTTAVTEPMGRPTMVSTAGLRSLVAGRRSARQAGCDLRIARPSEQVRTVLEPTDLDRGLRPAAGIQDAFGAA